MARRTERHEVVRVVGAALPQGKNMVYLLCGRCFPLLCANRANRVLGNIAVAYFLPLRAIPLFGSGIALVFVVMGVCSPLVLIAIAAIHQGGAAGIAAGVFGLSRHIQSSFML